MLSHNSVDQKIAQFAGMFNEVAIGYNDSGCFWHFCWGPRGAGSMMAGDRFASDSDDLSEALDELLAHLGASR